MQSVQWKGLSVVLLLGFSGSVAWAHGHHHSHFGIGLGYYGPGFYGSYGYGGYGFGRYGFGGYGYGYPSYYYSPWYAYPPTVIVPATPPVYIERQETQPAQSAQPDQPQSNFWYYCRNPDGYYPYVKSCPGGWLPVPPRPAGQ